MALRAVYVVPRIDDVTNIWSAFIGHLGTEVHPNNQIQNIESTK